MAPLERDGSWTGCMMNRLGSFLCMIRGEAQDLVHWMNDVHRRGLSEHAVSCEHDIKAIFWAGGSLILLQQSGHGREAEACRHFSGGTPTLTLTSVLGKFSYQKKTSSKRAKTCTM